MTKWGTDKKGGRSGAEETHCLKHAFGAAVVLKEVLPGIDGSGSIL
jgi:hypothetical protein